MRIALAFALLGCTTTLDPSVIVREDGGGGTSGDRPEPCEVFTSDQSDYLVCPERLDRTSASADCERQDATLASVSSQEENDFVAASSESLVMGDWWLGGMRDDTFVWSWPDATVFWRGGPDGTAENGAFTYWKPGEPNNASTTSPDPERCLALTPADDWNDRACELRLPYVCERPQ